MCTNESGPPSVKPLPWWEHPAYPQNAWFTSSFEWQRKGVPMTLVADDAASMRVHVPVRRPNEPLAIGDVLHPIEDCSRYPDLCEYELVIGAPDMTPPSRPNVSVETQLVRDPAGTGAFTCGDTDYLVLTIDTVDDRAPHDRLMLAAYVGTDDRPTLTFGYDYGDTNTASVALGDAVSRVRGSSALSSHDEICFSVTAIDWAGNESEHSDVHCVDTDDPNDPSVVWVEGSGCCSASGGDGSIVLAAIVLAQISRQRLGRRRCTS